MIDGYMDRQINSQTEEKHWKNKANISEARMNTRTHKHRHTNTHKHAHTHKQTYTYTQTQTCLLENVAPAWKSVRSGIILHFH